MLALQKHKAHYLRTFLASLIHLLHHNETTILLNLSTNQGVDLQFLSPRRL